MIFPFGYLRPRSNVRTINIGRTCIFTNANITMTERRHEDMDILSLSAVELGKKIKAGEISAMEATQATLAQIEKEEPRIHGYVTVDAQGALKQAEEIQGKIERGELTGPLAGVPAAIKDNICIKGRLTTCSSKILSNYKPTYTAEAVEHLQDAGAIILGKTNMDEFAMGSTTRPKL